MKIAIFSDVHGDYPQLLVALAHAEHLGCELMLCAGDLVDGEPFPEELIAKLQERSIPCVRGNHDRWAVGAGGTGGASDPYDESVGLPYDFSAFGLSRKALRYLANLRAHWASYVDGVRVAVYHGRPGDDMRGVFPDVEHAEAAAILEAAGAEILLLGHTHEAFVAHLGPNRLIANPGSLWGGGGGSFGVLDVSARAFKVYRAGGGELNIPRRRL